MFDNTYFKHLNQIARIHVDAQSNFDYKLLMKFGSSRSNVSSGPIKEGKKWFERARYGEWRGKAFSKKTLPLTAWGGPIESANCNWQKFLMVLVYRQKWYFQPSNFYPYTVIKVVIIFHYEETS